VPSLQKGHSQEVAKSMGEARYETIHHKNCPVYTVDLDRIAANLDGWHLHEVKQATIEEWWL